MTVELPTGSRLTAEVSVGGVRTVGRLGATRIKSSMGPVDLDATGDLWLRAAHGNATVGTADGGSRSRPTTGRSGSARSPATRSSRRRTARSQVGESGGDLDAKLSYGDLEITKALGSVTAKTAYGSIQLREVSSGSIQVESGYGQVTVGVRPGVPPGSTCPRRTGTCATSSTATAPPTRPSGPSRCAPAPSPATSSSSAPAERANQKGSNP